MTLKGIDVASYQSTLDAGKIAGDFVIVKATEGVGYVNPYCDKHFQQALKAGKLLGVYHFARNTKNSAEAEADFFVKNIKGYLKKAVLILDWEDANTADVAWAKRWLDRVHELTGVRPMIYMSEAVVNAHDWSSVAKADYGLWVARYRDYAPDINYDMSLAGDAPSVKWWKGYAMWQWTSSGRLSGYGGNLDCNVFYGTAAAWDKYAGGVAAPAPTSPKKPTKPAKPSTAPTPRKSYRVAKGDTAIGIASRYGMSLATLKALNPNAGHPAGNLDLIWPGDVLLVSGTPVAKKKAGRAIYTTVPSGVAGFLSSLAAKYGSSVDSIVNWNKAKYPSISADRVQAGWYIRVK